MRKKNTLKNIFGIPIVGIDQGVYACVNLIMISKQVEYHKSMGLKMKCQNYEVGFYLNIEIQFKWVVYFTFKGTLYLKSNYIFLQTSK